MEHLGRIFGAILTRQLLAGLVVVSIGVIAVNVSSFKTNSIEGWSKRFFSLCKR